MVRRVIRGKGVGSRTGAFVQVQDGTLRGVLFGGLLKKAAGIAYLPVTAEHVGERSPFAGFV